MPRSFFDRSPQETAKLARTLDWKNHPLGPPETWPVTLRVTLGILFNTHQPMFLFWGKDHYCFYNDGYIPILGNLKHPSAMGKAGKEVWAEIWPLTYEQIQIAEHGKSSWHVNRMLPVSKDGVETESYFTYGYSPVYSEDGAICGAFVSASETTDLVLSEKRLQQAHQKAQDEKQNAELARTQLHEFFMQSPFPMTLLLAPDHLFAIANPPYEKMVGRKVAGKKVLEVFKEEEVGEFLKIVDGVYATGVAYRSKERKIPLRNESGELDPIYLNINYNPFLDSKGAVVGVLAFHQDVTQEVLSRKAVENSERNLNLALDSANIGFWNHDFTTGYTSLSETLTKQWDIDPETYDHTLATAIKSIHPEDRKSVETEIERAVNERTPYSIEYRVIRASGEIIWILAKGKVFYNDEGAPIRITGVAMNISERKELQLNLERSKEAAEAASMAKSGFLANMSHEIRTPLGVMMGFADLALHHEGLPTEIENYLKAINRNGQMLTTMIGEILDLSKIEASRMEIETVRFQLPNLLDEIVSSMNVRASEKGVQLSLVCAPNIPQFVKSDPTRLRQILVNLIGNSIKFTEKGEVRVVVQVKEKANSVALVEFMVHDTGIGMNTQQTANLFQPFVQADSTMTRKYGGTGLGLALSQQLARAMGGTVRLEKSIPDEGSTFSFTIHLPYIGELQNDNSPALETKPSTAPSATELAGKHILLVEDSIDNQILFSRYLKSAGAQVSQANNGEEGINKALNENHDLILMDIQMPIKNGHEATAELRQRGYKKPIIALTAHAFKEERDRAMTGGFSEYLTKPLKRQTLIDTILRLT